MILLRLVILTLFFTLHFSAIGSESAPLKKAIVSEISGSVVLKKEGVTDQKAELNSVVSGKDIIQTGKKSRAELEFPDQSISRLGSNTIFSFDPQTRDMALSRGLAVVHVPAGRGGARIATPAATAAIQGDTIVAEALKMPDGTTACKFTALSPPGGPTDGKIIITLDKNPDVSFQMKGGEVAIVPQGATSLSQCPRVEIDVAAFVNKSPILKDAPPSAKQEMNIVSADQARAFASGVAQRTDIAIDGIKVVKVDANGNVAAPATPKPEQRTGTDRADPNAPLPAGATWLADGSVMMADGAIMTKGSFTPEGSFGNFAGGPRGFDFNNFNQFLAEINFRPEHHDFVPPQYTRYTGIATPTISSVFTIDTGTGSFGSLTSGTDYAFSALDGIGHFSFNTLTLSNPGTITVNGANNLIIHTENNTSAGNSLVLSGTVDFNFAATNPKRMDAVAERGNVSVASSAAVTANGSANLGAFSGSVTMGSSSSIDTTGAAAGDQRGVTVFSQNNATIETVKTGTSGSTKVGGNIDIRSNSAVALNGALTSDGGGNGAVGRNAGNISVVGNSVSVVAAADLSAKGGDASGGTGGNGGTISIATAGAFTGVAGQLIEANGGTSTSGAGGNGGNILIKGTSVTIPDTSRLDVQGGAATTTGGNGGTVVLAATAVGTPAMSALTTSDVTIINAAGGNSSGSPGGNGGTISFSAPSSSTITVSDTTVAGVGSKPTLSAAGGTGTPAGSNGTITSSPTATTSGGGYSQVP